MPTDYNALFFPTDLVFHLIFLLRRWRHPGRTYASRNAGILYIRLLYTISRGLDALVLFLNGFHARAHPGVDCI